MKVLAVESSATAASVALMEEEKILSEFFIHTGLTHSQTLMPMVEQVLKCAGRTMEDVDAFAVSVGPGSFTGVRIGVSSVKGLAFGTGKPCVGVSTLEAMAQNYREQEITVCAVMDARCQQVYNAMFACKADGAVERLCEDRAISLQELQAELKNYTGPVVLVGDGAALCWRTFGQEFPLLSLAPEHLRYQHARGVARIAREKIDRGEAVSDAQLVPVYLRLSQAERELKNKS